MNFNHWRMKGSTCGRRVLLALEEAKAPYEFELVHLFTGANKTPEYLALHPFGRIPVLKDGDFTLFESRAIIRYVASVYDKAGTLYPADAKARALVEQWISVEQSYYVAAEELVGQLVFAPMMGGQPNADKVKDSDARLHSTLAVLDKHLSKSTFFAGDNFTIAGRIPPCNQQQQCFLKTLRKVWVVAYR